IEDDANYCGRDCGKGCSQSWLGVDALEVGGGNEDPQKAGGERGPQCHNRAKRSHEQRWSAAVAIGGEKSDKLRDQDEWTGRRLREAESIDHLARLEPPVMLDHV